jgi:hypothetical protein
MGHPEAWNVLPDVAAGTSTSDDLAAVQEHVAGCGECQVELERLREAVSLLTGAPALLDPPAHLRDRVLAIPRQPVLLPELDDQLPRAARWRWFEQRRSVAASLLVAAAAAAIVIAFLVTRQANGARTIALQPPPHATQAGAWGKAVWGKATQGNVPITITVGDLRTTQHGFYEVWFGKGTGARHSVGTFDVSRDSSTTVRFEVPKGIDHEYAWIWVTREPNDGNPAPSKDTVLVADL